MAPPGVSAKRQLPAKENVLFKELLSLYESHQHKKAQKVADQILKKHPEHGETLAMKGLVTIQVGKRDEGLDLIRKGIRFDLTSHIVWHVFGLAKKLEKDYEEAAKSYQQALKYDPENINILRDSANLHMQLRNYDSLEEDRLNLLRLRPNQRQNWIGLAVAYQKNGNLRETKQLLETYEELLKNIPENDAEHSEILLYHVRVLEDLGEYNAAMELLELSSKSRRLMDPIAVLEFQARLHCKLKQRNASDARWRQLIDLNPDSEEYYEGYMQNHDINLSAVSPENSETCIKHLLQFQKRYPRSSTAARLALQVTEGQQFRDLVNDYIMRGLKKGVPSLFVDLEPLMNDDAKRGIIEELLYSIDSSSRPDDDDPTILVWALYFLAQLASSKDDHVGGLKLLERLADHTPTLPEIYTLKAKILKRAGDPLGASDVMELARQLDGQDRFLNWKAAKYLLRAGKYEAAQALLGLFTKKDAPSPSSDLEEMQCLAYLMEEGDAFLRLNHLGMALKRYLSVDKIFSDTEDDQFDFHSYALRKSTINSYLDVINWEDRVRECSIYIHCALKIVNIYLRLHKDPTSNQPVGLGEVKKAIKKAKKSLPKVQDEVKKAPPGDSNGAPSGQDEDPYGQQLAAVSDPLVQASRVLQRLEAVASTNLDVWLASFDVAVRRKKVLQAIRALKRAYLLDAENAELHVRVMTLHHNWSPVDSGQDQDAQAAINDALRTFFPGDIPSQLRNSMYLQRHSTDPRAIYAAARVTRILNGSDDEYHNLISRLCDASDMRIELHTATIIWAGLQSEDSKNAEVFAMACARRFPLATTFTSRSNRPAVNGTHTLDESTEFIF